MNPRRWTEAQMRFIRENLLMSDKDLAEAVSALGPRRTEVAVNRWRLERGYAKRRGAPVGHKRQGEPLSPEEVRRRKRAGGIEGGLRTKGWPVMRFSEDTRDLIFRRQVIAEAKRLGLIGQPAMAA